MNRISSFDSDSGTATGGESEFVQGLRGATRIAERYSLTLQMAAFLAVTTAIGFAWHPVATRQIGNNVS